MEVTLAELNEELASLIREVEDIPTFSDPGRFGPNPPAADHDLTEFEAAHGVTLPAEYREFLLYIGNGGWWPLVPQKPFGGIGLDPWRSWDFRPGVITDAFPHTYAWNDPSDEPFYGDALDVSDDAEFERRQDEWGDRYFSLALLSGAVPLHDSGCGRCVWLVVNGPLSGTVWFDSRADRLGIYPITNHYGQCVRFSEWMLMRVVSARRRLRRERNRAEPGSVLST